MHVDKDKLPVLDMCILAGAALLVHVVTFVFQTVPGYMDAEYYFAGAINLFQGNGFTETYLWNTLSLPPSLPFASHLYWMPLPSIIGYSGLVLFNTDSFLYARLPFLLITILIPPLTYRFTAELGGGRKISLIAGLMAIFAGVYVVYLSLVEAFSPYMLLGGLILFLIYRLLSNEIEGIKNILFFAVFGILAALMHLTRADGILWLGFCGLIPLYWIIFKRQWKKGLITGATLIIAYSLIMFPWYLRNWQLFQQLFPPGNQYALFLTEYNDNFLYPASLITPQRWLATGFSQIIADRLKALLANFLTGWMIQFEVILLPFFIIWLKQKWDKAFSRWVMLCYGLQFLVMSLVFPYAGMRGGFLHSGSAFQILFWSASAIGFYQVIHWWIIKKAHFDLRISVMFAYGLVFILAVVTAMMYQQKVFGAKLDLYGWQKSAGEYDLLNKELISHGITEAYSVMINNPPGFYLQGGRKAIVVPNADIYGVRELAGEYGIDYLILDAHIVPELADFFYSKESVPGIEFIFEAGNFQVYAFLDEGD